MKSEKDIIFKRKKEILHIVDKLYNMNSEEYFYNPLYILCVTGSYSGYGVQIIPRACWNTSFKQKECWNEVLEFIEVNTSMNLSQYYY